MGVLLLLVPRSAEGGPARRESALVAGLLRAAGSWAVLSGELLATTAPSSSPTSTSGEAPAAATVQHFAPGLSIVSATAQTMSGLPADAALIGVVQRRDCEQLTFASRSLPRSVGRKPTIVVVEYHSHGLTYDGSSVTWATTFLRSAASGRPSSCFADQPIT